LNNPDIYIGIMSGTSIDCVDAVAVTFSNGEISIIGSHSESISAQLKLDILCLCQPGKDSIALYAETDNILGELFAQTALDLMTQLNIKPYQVAAIGSHGQTIRHQPPTKTNGFSLQIGNPNLIAARTRCPVVADFRRADMALGGHGAPLVPAFHQRFFHEKNSHRVIINIGGIANVTLLGGNDQCSGFDTGPGNILLDAWCFKHRAQVYDHEGAWAATGNISKPLLNQLKKHPFFSIKAPKSTGREDFNLLWLEQEIVSFSLAPEDIQATLTALTAETITDAIADLTQLFDDIFVCGGGVFNTQLMNQLNQSLYESNQPAVKSTLNIGLDPKWVEACAFAWLAKRRIENKTGNVPAVTGASPHAVLGGLYLP
jgi:anhydro-N-acetylmuramic acid kinase